MNTEAKQIADRLRNPVRSTHRAANGYPISESEALQAMDEAADLIEQQERRIAELESGHATTAVMATVGGQQYGVHVNVAHRIKELEAAAAHVETMMTVSVNGREHAVPPDVALRLAELDAVAKSPWRPVADAPSGRYMLCRKSTNHPFIARRIQSLEGWIDRDGNYRDPDLYMEIPPLEQGK